jgi:hypothetical protein
LIPLGASWLRAVRASRQISLRRPCEKDPGDLMDQVDKGGKYLSPDHHDPRDHFQKQFLERHIESF